MQHAADWKSQTQVMQILGNSGRIFRLTCSCEAAEIIAMAPASTAGDSCQHSHYV